MFYVQYVIDGGNREKELQPKAGREEESESCEMDTQARIGIIGHRRKSEKLSFVRLTNVHIGT